MIHTALDYTPLHSIPLMFDFCFVKITLAVGYRHNLSTCGVWQENYDEFKANLVT